MNNEVIAEIAAERKRQIEVEGWTAEHDDQHSDGQLAAAAAGYAIHASGHCEFVLRSTLADDAVYVPRKWPWRTAWWKPKNARRDLIRAAALIVAEIERLDRAAAPTEARDE